MRLRLFGTEKIGEGIIRNVRYFGVPGSVPASGYSGGLASTGWYEYEFGVRRGEMPEKITLNSRRFSNEDVVEHFRQRIFGIPWTYLEKQRGENDDKR